MFRQFNNILMFTFNFYKGSLSWFKKITRRDLFMVFVFCFIIASIFREEIKEIIPHSEKDIFAVGVDEQLDLQYILNDICATHNVDYLNINLFHNGTISASGYHFKKMSCIAEATKEGKLPRIQHLQNWVIEPFKTKISIVKKVGFVYLSELKKDKEPYFSQFLTKYKIGSVFYVGLFDSRKKDQNGNNHFIGFISFAWEHETNWKESELVNMIKEKHRIKEFILK